MNIKKKLKLLQEVPKKRCKYCGSKENLTYDHKFPVVLGGKDDASNIQVLCKSCNIMKSGVPHGQLMRLIQWWLDIQGFEHKRLKPIKKI